MRAFLSLLLLVVVLPALVLALPYSGMFRNTRVGRLPGSFRPLSYHKEGSRHVQSYLSPPLPLAAGEVVNTDPHTTVLEFPRKPIALQSFRAEVVDEFGASVSLFEVYNHHWIVMQNGHENNYGPCGSLPYVFGVGEECRNTFVNFPGNYRLMTTGNETFTANIHLLRTVNVPAVKQCIECHCGDVNNPYNGGGFPCCPDGSFCPTDTSKPNPPVKAYYLKYTLYYDDVDPKYIPIGVMVMDVAQCNVEYNIPPCMDPASGCVVTSTQQITLAADINVVYAVGHVHPGSINITLFANGESLCTSYPIYGNGTTPGNENGYVVGLTTCTYDNPVFLKAGTVLTNTAHYNSTTWHDGVMGLFYIAFAKPANIEQIVALM